MSEANTPRDAASNALKQARLASRKGDLKSAERWSKTAGSMAKAATELAAQPPSYEKIQAARNEFYLRIKRMSDSFDEVRAWRETYDAWLEARARAEAEGAPLPEEAPLHPMGRVMDPRFADFRKEEFNLDV